MLRAWPSHRRDQEHWVSWVSPSWSRVPELVSASLVSGREIICNKFRDFKSIEAFQLRLSSIRPFDRFLEFSRTKVVVVFSAKQKERVARINLLSGLGFGSFHSRLALDDDDGRWLDQIRLSSKQVSRVLMRSAAAHPQELFTVNRCSWSYAFDGRTRRREDEIRCEVIEQVQANLARFVRSLESAIVWLGSPCLWLDRIWRLPETHLKSGILLRVMRSKMHHLHLFDSLAMHPSSVFLEKPVSTIQTYQVLTWLPLDREALKLTLAYKDFELKAF